MSDFQFRPAERKRVAAKVAFVGPSGSGKSWSGLLFLRGLVGAEGLVAAIDTENDSLSMYEGLIKTERQPRGFDVLNLTAPYTVERYLKGIEVAEKAGYHALLIDQISWMWNGTGGLLEMVDQLSKSKKGGPRDAWREVDPIFNDFVERLLVSDVHILATVRAKAAIDWNSEEKKKTKIGMEPIQRPGVEYEFYTVFDLDAPSNNATVSKDRTGIFKNHKLPITLEDGQKLREFLESGRAMAQNEKRSLMAAQTKPAPTPKPANGGSTQAPQPSEPVIDMKQRKALFATAETLKVTNDQVATLLEKVGGVTESAKFPAAKYEELMRELAKLAAGGNGEQPKQETKAPVTTEQPGQPTEKVLTAPHRKIIESTITNTGLTPDDVKDVLKEFGAQSLDAFPEAKFSALMKALLPEEDAGKAAAVAAVATTA